MPTTMSQETARPVLSASAHDVRYFVSLLRGINFGSRATVNVNKDGFTVLVEEARTLLGTAYIVKEVFDEYSFDPEPKPESEISSQLSDLTPPDDEGKNNAVFELPLNTLIECLNIFGTAGASSSSNRHGKKWARADGGEGSDYEGDDRAGRRNIGADGRGGIHKFFGTAEKTTGIRLSYPGSGYPLTLVIAEDATGPTTSCELTTFEPEPHLELPFDPEDCVLKIILKSSWLSDALSELDPSYDKLTFIGNPVPELGSRAPRDTSAKSILRIQAAGTFGSTEMDYPNDREVLETFECSQPMRASYRFALISRAIRALQSSTKTSLRISSQGLLSMQFLMPNPSPRRGAGTSGAFIDFVCLALDEEVAS